MSWVLNHLLPLNYRNYVKYLKNRDAGFWIALEVETRLSFSNSLHFFCFSSLFLKISKLKLLYWLTHILSLLVLGSWGSQNVWTILKEIILAGNKFFLLHLQCNALNKFLQGRGGAQHWCINQCTSRFKWASSSHLLLSIVWHRRNGIICIFPFILI